MQKTIKVMRYMGANTKRGYFYRGRIYKVEVTFYSHNLLTRIFAGMVGDSLPYAKVEYNGHRKRYEGEYKNAGEFSREWRTENNAMIANAMR